MELGSPVLDVATKQRAKMLEKGLKGDASWKRLRLPIFWADGNPPWESWQAAGESPLGW
jgi:hypothetical protein